jgi:hypothetical protein
MTLSPEAQLQLDLEVLRQSYTKTVDDRRTKLDTIRLAKEVLMENSRNRPVDESAVSAEDIISFADKLANYLGE